MAGFCVGGLGEYNILNMSQTDIEIKAAELEEVLTKYKSDLGSLEKELLAVVAEYKKALEAEKIKKIKASLN